MKDKNYWNGFYSNNPGEMERDPSAFLKDHIDSLRKGKAIDVACGAGRNSLLLAEKGFSVEAMDFSDVAISKAVTRSTAEGKSIEFKTMSLDFYLAPIQKYDTIIAVDYKCIPRLIDEIKKGLVIGGTFLVEAYTYNHLKNNPKTEMETDECYKSFELANILSRGWNLLYYDERVINGESKARAIAIKPSY